MVHNFGGTYGNEVSSNWYAYVLLFWDFAVASGWRMPSSSLLVVGETGAVLIIDNVEKATFTTRRFKILCSNYDQ